jgi:protein-tyrosine-phosphatase
MPENILFVCVENAGRSQMAEAFFKKYSGMKFNIISAGTIPSSELNPVVVQVMKEIGIDMLEQSPKILLNIMIENSHKIVNMGCVDEESCPSIFVKDVIDWNVSDPKTQSIEQVRIIRDQIKSNVLDIIDLLKVD